MLFPSCRQFLFTAVRWIGVGAVLTSSAIGLPIMAISLGNSDQNTISPAIYSQQVTNASAVTSSVFGVQLSGQDLFQFLVAELAVQRGLFHIAQQHYLELAARTRDLQVIKRALNINLVAQDLPRALEMARLLVQIQPHDIESHRILAQLLLSIGQQTKDQAITELRWLITKINQHESSTGAGFHAISALLSKTADKALAIEIMHRIVVDYQDNADALFALAMVMGSDEDNLETSLKYYQLALALAPADERIIQSYVSVLRRAERFEPALSVLAEHLAAHPSSYAARFEYARTLILAEHNEQALEVLQQILVEYPEDHESNYTLGLLLAQLKRFSEAERVFKRLIHVPQQKYAAWYHLAKIHEEQELIDDAIAAYERVVDGQHRFNAKIQIALLIANQGKLALARKQLHQSEPRNTEQRVRVHRIEAHLLAEEGLYAEAMVIYNLALKNWPKNDKLLLDRAMLAEKSDDLDALKRDLQAIIKRSPNHAEALNSLGYTLADRTDRTTEALGYIERAYAIKPNSYYIVDSMGWVMYRLGRYAEAIRFLRQALALYRKENPDQYDQEIALHLGEVLWVSGNQEEAQRIWDKTLQFYPDSEMLRKVLKRLKAL